MRCIFYFNPYSFRVKPDAVAIDESREGTIGGKRLRGADGETVLLHQPETVGELQRQLYIVSGEQDCLVLLVCQAAEHLKGFYLAGEIEEGGSSSRMMMRVCWASAWLSSSSGARHRSARRCCAGRGGRCRPDGWLHLLSADLPE